MLRLMRATGAVGVLCNGVIRDIASLQEMKFPVWAGGFAADRGGIRFHRYQAPIEIAGRKVNPGDLVMADENGALIVPFDRLADLLAAAARVLLPRKRSCSKMSSQRPISAYLNLYEFYSEALKSARS